MKKLQRISFHLHWVTLCCFLLPFFYDSCSKKPDKIADTSAVVVPVDLEDSIYKADAPDTADATIGRDTLLSETIIKKFTIFKPILIPAEGTHSGIAGIINTIPLLSLFAITISFILLIIGLLAKLIDKNSTKIFLLLEACALLFLAITRPPFFDYDTLWGYWLCMACISVLMLIDAYSIYKQKGKEI